MGLNYYSLQSWEQSGCPTNGTDYIKARDIHELYEFLHSTFAILIEYTESPNTRNHQKSIERQIELYKQILNQIQKYQEYYEKQIRH